MALHDGPLTREDLLDIWRASVDDEYARPLEEAGDGEGIEVYGQAAEQLARVSQAIDATTQGMFLLPWSGQTSEPAGGARLSTVTLTFSRTKRLERPLVLAAGTIVEEETTDWGEDGPVLVRPGRSYLLDEDLVFHPGEAGPLDVPASAANPGPGYDNAQEGTITHVSQVGEGFENDLATVSVVDAATPTASGPFKRATLVAFNEPDMFVPDHVGQYVLFTEGANAGKVARALAFGNPEPPLRGSTIDLEAVATLRSSTFAGEFSPGETVAFDAGGPALGYGRALGYRDAGGVRQLTVRVLSGATAANATGATSGATMTGAVAFYPEDSFSAETEAAAWRVLSWERDFGLSATNAAAPSGGRLAVLDMRGDEDGCARAPGEGDDSYRQRIVAISDTVSPNAIRRSIARSLGPLPYCFREVGYPELRGWFYDGTGAPAGESTVAATAAKQDAYDTDVLLLVGAVTSGSFSVPAGSYEPLVLEEMPGQLVKAKGYFGRLTGGTTMLFVRTAGSLPDDLAGHRVRGLNSGAIFAVTSGSVPATVAERRFRRWLDYAQFRAFFMVGLPRLAMGEFGFAYDAHPRGAYDAGPSFLDAYDGFPRGAAALYRRVWQAVERAHGGGVSFEFYLEDGSCP